MIQPYTTSSTEKPGRPKQQRNVSVLRLRKRLTGWTYREDDRMRVLQTISFLALMLGVGGIENQNGELQPVAIGIMFLSLITLFITNKIASAA